jgi:hypothetical protein
MRQRKPALACTRSRARALEVDEPEGARIILMVELAATSNVQNSDDIPCSELKIPCSKR